MDSSLVKLIGPWARIIDPNKHSSVSSRLQQTQQQGTSGVKDFTGFTSSSSVNVNKSTAVSSQSQRQQQQPQRSTLVREKIDVNFAQLHKIQSSKFIRGAESRRESRASQSNVNRKIKRTELHNARRELRAISPISDEDSFSKIAEEVGITSSRMESNNKTGAGTRVGGATAGAQMTMPMTKSNLQGDSKRTEMKLQSSSNRLNSNQSNLHSKSTAVASNPSITSNNSNNIKLIAAPVEVMSMKASEKRKMQLLEYQKTKMELAKKVENKPRPFKPGGVVAPVPSALTKSNVLTGSVITNRNRIVPVDKVSTKINANHASGPGKGGHANHKEDTDRRVTRAMAKGGLATATMNTQSSNGLKPTINQMKNLNINGKQPQASGTVNNKLQGKTASKQVVDKMQNVKVAIHDEEMPEAFPEIQAPVAPAAPKKVVKAKPKPIDAVYSNYNCLFAAACGSLTENVSCWESIQGSNSDIPDAIKDDIDAALGQANLLLKSKLPQFAQLLYQYIYPPTEEDTPPILGCDLEGWWDVAKIQVDKVTDSFKRLENLKNNDWNDSIEEKEVKRGKKSSSSSKSPKPKQLKVPAPLGMSNFRKFLLSKKAAEIQPESEDKDMKVFDAGLFQIQSPASPAPSQGTPMQQRRSTRRSGIVQNGQTQMSTPTRNGSVTTTPASQQRQRLSFVQMSIRRSMGPLYRCGAVSEQPQEEDDDVSILP